MLNNIATKVNGQSLDSLELQFQAVRMPTSSNAAHPWANNINQTLSNIAVQQSPLTH
jgi:hypothetical protein